MRQARWPALRFLDNYGGIRSRPTSLTKFRRLRYYDVSYATLCRHGGIIIMIRTQIQMEEDQIEWLRAEARARGVSVSQLIREGITLFRAREERFPEEKKKRALAAVGRFSSGASDVSERHDDYLAMAFSKEHRHGK